MTNILSKALQRKDQNMVEAVSLIETTKQRFANLNGIDKLARLMAETTSSRTFPLVY